MKKDSLGELNEILVSSILKRIVNQIEKNGGKLIQKEVIDNYSGPPEAKESEIRSTINWGIKNNYLYIELKKPRDYSMLFLGNNNIRNQFTNKVDIVLSIPKSTELGLGRIKHRNIMLETREAFIYVIESAAKVLRISSPFFQANILDDGVLPELKTLFLEAFQRGCEIRILSREIFSHRSSDFEWLKLFSKKYGYSHLLKIYDYHIETPERKVVSSTHSKMLIADASLAYVGSGELRKNSIAHNFEIGCLIHGPIVAGLCESFDLMTRYSKVWFNDN